MKFVVAMMAVAGLGFIGCGGGDTGKDACIAYVAAYNECVAEAAALDEETTCPDSVFDAASTAGCSWTAYYEACAEGECTDEVFSSTCSGTCE